MGQHYYMYKDYYIVFVFRIINFTTWYIYFQKLNIFTEQNDNGDTVFI